MESELQVTSNVKLFKLVDGVNQLVAEEHNLIVNGGLTILASGGFNLFEMAFGSGTTPVQPTDTGLQTPLTNGEVSNTGTNPSSGVCVLDAVIGPGFATGTIAEAAIANNFSPLAQFFARVVFAQPQVKTDADTFTAQWTISLGTTPAP